jgi:hypothetical protein
MMTHYRDRHGLAMPGDLWQAVHHGKQRQRKSRKKEAQEGSAAKGISAYGYYDKQARRSQNLAGRFDIQSATPIAAAPVAPELTR